mgnify:CR=1 FL=1
MGLREALEQIKALTEIPFAHTAGDHELIYQIASEALAQQPAGVVELTDAEIVNAMLGSNSWPNADRTCFRTIHAVRAVIAAHIAKQVGAT